MEKLTESKEITWHQLEEDHYISSDSRWKISCDYELSEDGNKWNISNWIICYSVNANSDWVGVEICPTIQEAKAIVLRLRDFGEYG